MPRQVFSKRLKEPSGSLRVVGEIMKTFPFPDMRGFPFSVIMAVAFSFHASLLNGQDYTFGRISGWPGQEGRKDGTNSVYRVLAPLLHSPEDLAVANDGQVYVADTGNFAIRTITRTGTNWITSTLPVTNAPLGDALSCTGVAVDAATNVYVADAGKAVVWKLTQTGTNWMLTLIAGSPGVPGLADGTNSDARFDSPCGLSLDGHRNIYLAEFRSHLIRKITPVGTNWVVSTLAGLANVSGRADGTNSEARFNRPNMIAADRAGDLYVTDVNNSTIRKMTPLGTNWVVSTPLGLAGVTGAIDGTNNDARFNRPYGVKVDRSGNLLIADTFNHMIRKATPVGTNLVVTTIGGATNSGAVDGVGTNARFYGPTAVASDSTGDIYVADTFNNTIRWGDAEPLLLRIVLSGSTVSVAWPTWATNFTLERSDSLSPSATWTSVDDGAELFDSGWCKTNNASAGSAFFRLRRQ
jgi:sugar lactone lactonase YvrE